jgi:hypothetical protein
MTIPRLATFLGLAGLALALLGCASTTPLRSTASDSETGAPAAGQAAYGHFTDIPIPSRAEMDIERSLILGSADEWLGRIVLGTAETVPEVFDFYRREMPSFGWGEITIVRAEVSVLTYERAARVATVQISGSALGGTDVSITVSPKGRPAKSLQ